MRIKQLLGLLMSMVSPTHIMAEPVKGPATDNGCPAALNYAMRPLNKQEAIDLCQTYQGQTILIVNTASQCGFTPQFTGLEQLYQTYKDRGFVILGFPSNDFGAQDPGTEDEIQTFCQINYGVTFPMFEKIAVTEGQAAPLYQTLASMAGEYPKWNFHKYLLNPQGELIGSFTSTVKPDNAKLRELIEANLP